MVNFANALGNIGLMYQGANAQELSDIQLKKLKDDDAVTSAIGQFDPSTFSNMFASGGAGNDIVGTQPMPQQGPPPQPQPMMPPPPPPSLGGAPGGAPPPPPPQGMPQGPMPQQGPPPPQPPPQGMPQQPPQGAPPQGMPQQPPNPQAQQAAQDPFVQQAMSITQSLPPAQRGLFYKNFYMPMLQQRAESQRAAQQAQETRADRRQTAEWQHEDRRETIKERYDAAKLASEDRRASAADRAAAREDALALRREMAEQNMEIKKGNLQARRDTLDMQRGKLQEAAAKGDATAKARLSELDDVQRQLDELIGAEGSKGNLGLGVTGVTGTVERAITPVMSFVRSLTGKPPPDTSAAEIKAQVKAVVPQITKILSGSKSSNGGAWTQARVEEALGALSFGTTNRIAQADAAALKKDLEAHRGSLGAGQTQPTGKVLHFDAQGNMVQ